MQETSALYKQLIDSDLHYFENQLIIDGVGTFGENQLFTLDTKQPSLEGKPAIGTAPSGEITVEVIAKSEDIPKMAKLTSQVRVTDGTQTSEWINKGIYFVDTRKESTHGSETTTILTGYDAMIKTEQTYPNTNHDWPYLDVDVVDEIAQTIGVDVDARTYQIMTAEHMINLPVINGDNGEDESLYTMREKLSQIAGLYCGNFIITPVGKLLLVPLYGFDPIVVGDYLADEDGNAITFGDEGWYTLV